MRRLPKLPESFKKPIKVPTKRWASGLLAAASYAYAVGEVFTKGGGVESKYIVDEAIKKHYEDQDDEEA